jgi:hypothetical protein
VLRVKSFSPDGLAAIADVLIMNGEWSVYDLATLTVIHTYRTQNRIDSDLLQFDPLDGKWKWSGAVSTVPIGG